MLKKMLAGALVLAVISTTSTFGYTMGNGDTDKEIKLVQENKVQVISPEESLVTSEKTVLLSGKAKGGSNIVVEVYSAKNFSQVNLDIKAIFEQNKNEEYTMTYRDGFKVGDLGVFTQELELSEGKNKILVHYQNDEGERLVIERYVLVSNVDYAKKQLENIESMNFLDTIKNIIENIGK